MNRRGAYFICSACMSSIPLLLPFFVLLAASYISSPVKGVIMAHGAYDLIVFVEVSSGASS